MKPLPTLLLIGSLLLAAAPTASACGGHRARCRCHHRRAVATACYPASAAHPSYLVPAQATLPTAQAAPQGVPVATAAPVPSVAEVQPAYEYAASTSGQPAYYYTYDESGKLIVAQWMDWVFRGGRAAGEPAPPLPIIGALRGR